MIMLTHPLWLWGLTGAAAIPLAAHLLARGRTKRMIFPAARFFLAADVGRDRWQRLRNFLLLFLRIACLAVIVLAFTQPVWSQLQTNSANTGHDELIVIDASASMRRAVAGVSLFDRATSYASRAIRKLDPARDRAAVILAGEHPRPVLPEPTANLTALAAHLADQSPTYQQARLDDAIELGRSLFHSPPEASHNSSHRPLQIILLTDRQASTYPASLIAKLRQQGIALRIPALPVAASGNLTFASIAAHPTVTSPGQPVQISATIANLGDKPADASVSLAVNTSGHPSQQTIHLAPRARASVQWKITLTSLGLHRLTAHLTANSNNALTCDDAMGILVRVEKAQPLRLITAASINDANTASHYLAYAIDPADPSTVPVIRPDNLPAADSDGATRHAFWLICDVSKFNASATKAILAHLQAGGNVWWFTDTPACADNLAALARMASKSTLPLLLPPGGGWVGHRSLTLASGDFSNPILSIFSGPSRTTLLSSRFTAGLLGEAAPNATVLLRFKNNHPALLLGPVGQGKLAIFAGSIRPAASDFVKGPAFLPLVREMIADLQPGKTHTPRVHPGEALPMTPVPGSQLLDPADHAIAASSTLARASAPGWYRMVNRHSNKLMAATWVSIAPDESDLTAISSAASSAASSATHPSPNSPLVKANEVVTAPHKKGLPLWPYFVLAGLGFLALEALAAGGRHDG